MENYDAIIIGTPTRYEIVKGASIRAGSDGSRLPSETELEGARFQARHVAEIAAKHHG